MSPAALLLLAAVCVVTDPELGCVLHRGTLIRSDYSSAQILTSVHKVKGVLTAMEDTFFILSLS